MFKIKLTDHVFKINSRHQYVKNLCIDYLIDEEPDVEISVTEKEIAYENSLNCDCREEYLESLAVYRKICEYLLDYNILLFHASSLAFDGKGYMFTAPSGTGKSTHARLWRERFQDRVVTINDDKPLISFGEEEVILHGTPYGGKHNLQNNLSFPLKGIVVLHQASKNSICRISAKEAFPTLLNQTYRRSDTDGMTKTIDLVHKLAELPIYSLGCTVSQDAVTLAYQALTGK